MIIIPSKKTLVAGDLLYNKVHLWLREGRFEAWTKALDRIAAITDIDTVIPGHGATTNRSLINENKNYISDFVTTVRELKSAAKATAKMKMLYPEHRMERFLTFAIDGYFEQMK